MYAGFERAEQSVSDAEIFDLSKQSIDIQRQISDIPPAYFKPERGKYMHEIFTTPQTTMTSIWIITKAQCNVG